MYLNNFLLTTLLQCTVHPNKFLNQVTSGHRIPCQCTQPCLCKTLDYTPCIPAAAGSALYTHWSYWRGSGCFPWWQHHLSSVCINIEFIDVIIPPIYSRLVIDPQALSVECYVKQNYPHLKFLGSFFSQSSINEVYIWCQVYVMKWTNWRKIIKR